MAVFGPSLGHARAHARAAAAAMAAQGTWWRGERWVWGVEQHVWVRAESVRASAAKAAAVAAAPTTTNNNNNNNRQSPTGGPPGAWAQPGAGAAVAAGPAAAAGPPAAAAQPPARFSWKPAAGGNAGPPAAAGNAAAASAAGNAAAAPAFICVDEGTAPLAFQAAAAGPRQQQSGELRRRVDELDELETLLKTSADDAERIACETLATKAALTQQLAQMEAGAALRPEPGSAGTADAAAAGPAVADKPYDLAFFQGYQTFSANYKQHNTALKWFREKAENSANPDDDTGLLFSNTEPMPVPVMNHPGGMNYDFDENSSYKPWMWFEMVAQLNADSMAFVVDGDDGRSCGLVSCSFAPRPNSYDHKRHNQLRLAGKARTDAKLRVWDFVLKRADDSAVRLHPQWSKTAVESYAVEGHAEEVEIPAHGLGESDGPGT